MGTKVKILEFLDSHLKFGCINSVNYHFYGDKSLTVKIFPFKKFFVNDLNFIRDYCLENDEVKSFTFVKLQFLDLNELYITAVYKFS